MEELTNIDKKVKTLFDKVSLLIEHSRKQVYTTINVAEVYTKYHIGQYIVEYEQQGKERAKYGKAILKQLSRSLTERFGEGWSVENLTLFRKFYMVYSKSENLVTAGYEIQNEGVNQSPTNQENVPIVKSSSDIKAEPKFTLSWSHYLVLMRISDPNARRFYEIECASQQWSKRQLSRQVGSSLYERLALSRDKDDVMRLANEGQTIEKPSDIVKDPMTLEFLGLKPDVAYSETKLENAIISKMQQFLLELGKGFLFEARQKRFTFEERNFYVDLVFYNRLLQCYVLIDLKTGDLTHQDLGQMQMYVNYYDRYVRQPFEHPTIGILLCERKSDALVELTLPKDANIYASQYLLYLPDKALLEVKLKEWIEEFETNKQVNGRH